MTLSSVKRKRFPPLLFLFLLAPSITSAFHDCIESVKESRSRRRRRTAKLKDGVASDRADSSSCHGGLCVGMKNGPHEGGPASYPTSWNKNDDFMAGTSVHSIMTVPPLPEFTDGITYYLWTDVFFGDAGLGRMNQLVPQLILGSALDGSSGPPEYRPKWGPRHDNWVFGAHYFFEIYNVTTEKVDGHAAYGELFATTPGERLWTDFRLEPGGDGFDVDSPRWVLAMGVVGDSSRTSRLVVDRPYMGLGTDPSWGNDKTFSWAEESYHRMCINSCWEMYGADDGAHLPPHGASYDIVIKQPTPGAFEFQSKWEQDEGNDKACPSSTVTERHNSSVQHVLWNISVGSPLQQPKSDLLISKQSLLEQWETWKAMHPGVVKSFSNKAEEARRYDIFEENVKFFELRGGSYELDETAILTENEFHDLGRLSCPLLPKSTTNRPAKVAKFSCPVMPLLSNSFVASSTSTTLKGTKLSSDWIDYRGTQVTPPKSQGRYGTCWSFGFVETIEGLGVRQGHPLTNVSNQEVIDCCQSCQGRVQDICYGFVIDDPAIRGRLAKADAYPYRGPPGNCSKTEVNVGDLAPARLGGCVRVKDDTNKTGGPILGALAVLGPAAFGIDAACLRGYKGGIITNCTLSRRDHVVLLVGAGLDETSDVPFFRAKNSWGTKWGEGGYFRFAQKGGQLGMGSAVFATSISDVHSVISLF